MTQACDEQQRKRRRLVIRNRKSPFLRMINNDIILRRLPTVIINTLNGEFQFFVSFWKIFVPINVAFGLFSSRSDSASCTQTLCFSYSMESNSRNNNTSQDDSHTQVREATTCNQALLSTLKVVLI